MSVRIYLELSDIVFHQGGILVQKWFWLYQLNYLLWKLKFSVLVNQINSCAIESFLSEMIFWQPHLCKSVIKLRWNKLNCLFEISVTHMYNGKNPSVTASFTFCYIHVILFLIHYIKII